MTAATSISEALCVTSIYNKGLQSLVTSVQIIAAKVSLANLKYQSIYTSVLTKVRNLFISKFLAKYRTS
jgi:hypothetical protein